MSPRCSGISRKVESCRRLVVSFHDLHPGSREICARFLDRIRTLGVERITLLVVPRWHGARPIHEDSVCSDWLREMAALGHEICLHGFFHRAEGIRGGWLSRLIGRHYTAGEGEFFEIDHSTALDRLERGLEILREGIGLPVVGFTPPAWLMSEAGREAARSCGLHYTTTFGRVELLQRRDVVHGPTIVYSCRSAWRRFVSRIWVRLWAHLQHTSPVLRIAVHPGDFVDPRVERSLFHRIEAALATGREAVTYRDLVADERDSATVDPLAVA